LYSYLEFSYSADLSFGPSYKNGIGLLWQFKPIDVFYGFRISLKNKHQIYIGPYFHAAYNWELFPELQSGHMFWFSSFEIGPKLSWSFPLKTKQIKLRFSNSLMGFTSRPEVDTETHFYSLKFSDFASNPHSNLQFGFNNLFNHTMLGLETKVSKSQRFSLGYQFEYFGIYDSPTLSYTEHSVNLKWIIGKL